MTRKELHSFPAPRRFPVPGRPASTESLAMNIIFTILCFLTAYMIGGSLNVKLFHYVWGMSHGWMYQLEWWTGPVSILYSAPFASLVRKGMYPRHVIVSIQDPGSARLSADDFTKVWSCRPAPELIDERLASLETQAEAPDGLDESTIEHAMPKHELHSA